LAEAEDRLSGLLQTLQTLTTLEVGGLRDSLSSLKRFVEALGRRKAELERSRKELSAEHRRLFRGVKPGIDLLPPYESLWRGGLLSNERTRQVREEYAKAGARLKRKELPDYIGVELSFMRFLCLKEAEAWKRGDEAGALEYAGMQKDFLEKHVLKWVPRFCDEVVVRAKLECYQAIATLIKAFLELDVSSLSQAESCGQRCRCSS
jgi:TorA maturation chaperone TorD